MALSPDLTKLEACASVDVDGWKSLEQERWGQIRYVVSVGAETKNTDVRSSSAGSNDDNLTAVLDEQEPTSWQRKSSVSNTSSLALRDLAVSQRRFPSDVSPTTEALGRRRSTALRKSVKCREPLVNERMFEYLRSATLSVVDSLHYICRFR